MYYATMTCGHFQPPGWTYPQPPSYHYYQNRALIPPKALPWYYTCDPLYLLGWLAMRVLPIWMGAGFVMRVLWLLT
jgi:hypothetical protein